MDTNWITGWLENLSLTEYISTFSDKGYTCPDHLVTIGGKLHLRDIGITKPGHLNRLHRALERLKSEHSVSLVGGVDGEGLDAVDGPRKVAFQSLCTSSIPSGDTTSSKKNPPPVPLRKSIRRVASSPSTSPLPDEPPGSDESAPPPVLPRQQSLKRRSPSPRSGGRGGDEMKPAQMEPQLSPIPQSPMTGAVEKEPDFSMAIPPNLTNNHSSGSNAVRMPVSHQPSQISTQADIKPKASTLDTRAVPKPKPRAAPRHKTLAVNRQSGEILSEQSSPSISPLPPPTATVAVDVNPPATQVTQSVEVNHSKNINPLSTPNGVKESVQPVLTHIEKAEDPVTSPTDIQPPALPPKKTATHKKNVIMPEDSVVFELENVPMPVEENNKENSEPEVNGAVLPPLPSKSSDDEIPPPATDTGNEINIEPEMNRKPSPPATNDPITTDTTLSSVASDNQDFILPLPPKGHHTNRDFAEPPQNNKTPPLPRKDSGPPSWSPPPPNFLPPPISDDAPLLLDQGPPILDHGLDQVFDPVPPVLEHGPLIPDHSPHVLNRIPPVLEHAPPVPEHTSPKLGKRTNKDEAPPPPPPRTTTLSPAYGITGLEENETILTENNVETTPKTSMQKSVPDPQSNWVKFDDAPVVAQGKEQDHEKIFMPPLPPKEAHLPPPPPPITEEDYPQTTDSEEYTDSEEEGPLISIQSSQITPLVDDNQMSLAPSSDNIGLGSENSTPPSSVECSPAHRTIIVRQQISPLDRNTNDDMILVSPTLDDNVDYMNQDTIDEANAAPATGDDYMNQDAIDQAMEDEDEEFESEKSMNRQRFTIRGTSLIKSRTLEQGTSGFDRDYENQEVLDEDIIPFLTTESSLDSGQPYTHSEPPDFDTLKKTQMGPQHDDIPPSPATVNLEQQKRPDVAPVSSASETPSPSRPLESPEILLLTSDGEETALDFAQRPLPQIPSKNIQQQDVQARTYPRSASSASNLSRPSFSDKPQTYAVPLKPDVRSSTIADSQFEDFDGARVFRTAGTFAGVDASHRRPDIRRYRSEDPYTSNRRSFEGTLSDSVLLHPGYSRHDSASLHDVPKVKDGFLFKKGGIQGDKPWQRRWVTFNSSELKYFKNQTDKDKSSRNVVHLSEMIDIKQVPEDDKPNRFDLVVINRVFQFSAASPEECKAWVNVLHAAISRFKPQEHEFQEGGTMHNPDKRGILMKQGHGFSKGFKERFVALKESKFAYYHSKEHFVRGHPIHILEMTLSSVRPDMTSKLPRFVITMNNQKQYVFQAANELDRKEWMDTMTAAILTGLDTRDLTIPRPGSRTSSQDVLKQIQENPANKVCADCASTDPVWSVVNMGIMVCIECSGVHRSMGTHISKVRSIELDLQIWKPPLIKIMKVIGNDLSNQFWEHHHQQRERLPANVEREIREQFIRAKYQTKSWIPRRNTSVIEVLNIALCENVKTDNVMETVRLFAYGCDPCSSIPNSEDSELSSALAIAKAHNRDLQVELLEQNGALICRRILTPTATVNKKGHLYKTGTDRTGWKRRYCALDKYKGFQYFKSETDSELLGFIRVEELFSVARCEEEITRDPKYKHCFEVNTQGRGYLFCAETEEEMEEWIRVFKQIISSDAAENLGYDKVGYLKKKEAHAGFKKRWFTLKGKSLSSYRREREEVDEIDLRKVTELKGPDSQGTVEQQCSLQIVMSDKTYHLRADSPAEAESWLSALRHTQVSGIPLAEQQLTSTGIPILIHKCLQFVESYGMETEGLYRLSGQKANIRKLILAFNQDARGVVIDPEDYNVHDVTGTLKLFFRSLPDPLLTHKLYPSFIATMQTEHEAQMYQLQSLIEELPDVNKETLRRVIGHLRKVSEHSSKNKMGLSNLVRLFGPTLMTVDGDAMSFANTNHECSCVHIMIEFYKWLFQVDEEEEKKEEMIEEAVQKIKEAEKMKNLPNISSSMDFLTTVYINSKEGESYNTKITGVSTVAEVVEDVATHKRLPPNNYALYLVLGDSESHRVLSFNERLLAVLCSTGSDCFLCLKPNTFGETLLQYMDIVKDGETVTLQVREKKKWKKYPCTVRNGTFIQFKDTKCHNEYFKMAVSELDVFTGIERRKIDIKNPMPSRYCFWLKANRGEENCKYLCAETEADMLKIVSAIVRAKYPDRLQTPVLPTRLPPDLPPPMFTDSLRESPDQQRRQQQQQQNLYANVKLPNRTK